MTNSAIYARQRDNHLLHSLPRPVRKQWEQELDLVKLELGQVLHEAHDVILHIYFPVTAIVSLLFVLENGASTEISVVGNEGIVGLSLIIAGGSTPTRAVVQSAGEALRIDAQFLRQEFLRVPAVLHLLLRYTQALITQMAQTAACNRHHSLDQQLCRWLLLSMDRLKGCVLIMTQDLIANMLGVRREGVTEAAGRLQLAGLIKYKRGHITVLDRHRLEKRTCECYRVVQKEYVRLLPQGSPT